MAEAKPTRQQNLSAATNKADQRLKAAHLEEWNGYMTEETKARGEKWAPKPTEAERAAAELEALLRAHPELADKVPDILGQPALPEGETEETSTK